MDNREIGFLELLKSGNEQGVIELYDTYRSEFIQWCMRSFSLREADAADLFQDSVIAFYHNVRNGRIVELSSTIKTYLFAIGRNLALKKLKKESRILLNEDVLNLSQELQQVDTLESDDQKKVIASLLKQIGEPCQSILRLFYFDKYSMDAIATKLGYKNEHVVKSQKLRCFNTLKKMTLQHYKQEDL